VTLLDKKHAQPPQVEKPIATPETSVEQAPAPALPPPEQAQAPTEIEPAAEIHEDDYADPDTVDQKAFAIDVPELPLPNDSGTTPGVLSIKVFVNASGQPDGIKLLEATLPEDYVATLAGIFQRAKFSPALQDKKAVKSWRILEISYGDTEVSENQEPTQ
jgi:hypothetical protein